MFARRDWLRIILIRPTTSHSIGSLSLSLEAHLQLQPVASLPSVLVERH